MEQFSYYMPTKLVYGKGTLAALPDCVAELGMTKVLLVTDKGVQNSRAYQLVIDYLNRAGVNYLIFDECLPDARLHHVTSQTQRIIREGIDGVISFGGGSVVCAGKAMAICAANNGKSFDEFAGVDKFSNEPLPMIAIPTTAGAGSEVSPWTLVKDEKSQRKFIGGGPKSFPKIAILDPCVLETIPASVSAIAGIDALTHAMDSLFNNLTTNLTEIYALGAIKLLVNSLRGSIVDRDKEAMADHLLGASMANLSCGNARLGLAHCISLPLEAELDIPHGIGVGVLMPRVFRYSAAADPERLRAVAKVWSVKTDSVDQATIIDNIVTKIYQLYEDIGFPKYYEGNLVTRDNIPELAMLAGKGLYGEGYTEESPTRGTLIASPSLRKARIADAELLLSECIQ